MTRGKNFTENEIDSLFRTAAFGMRKSHKDELRNRLFSVDEDELSEDEVLAAAGGNKEPDVPVDKLKY